MPCTARPVSSSGIDRLPRGAKPISNAPTILSTKPHITIFTRPKRSAKPPNTTVSMPENRAVMATAIFIISASSPKSF